MAQSNKAPRQMTNKFDSTCGDCGRAVDQGETILYHGRGYIQCNDCAPVNTTPSKPASNAQAWSDALSWDSDQPAAGSSIGGAATATATRPAMQPIKQVIPATVQPIRPSDDQLADTGAAIVKQAAAKVDPLDDISVADRAEALTSELLIILVNAIDVSGISGRHSLSAFCSENAKRSIDMSSRQHIWNGIRKAIQQA
jgi:hypothetical protein